MDANDLRQEEGEEYVPRFSDEPYQFNGNGHEEPPGVRHKLLTLDDLLEREPAGFIAENLIYEQGVALCYGEWGSGKTFVALGMALCIATGERWMGMDCMPGKVLYIVGEGGPGLAGRICAWEEGMGGGDGFRKALADRFRVIDGCPSLLSPDEPSTLHQNLREQNDFRPDLVVIDTLSRSIPGGNENAAEDVTRLLVAVDAIKKEYGCSVLLIHHPGKDVDRGARGSYALECAMDSILKVEKSRMEVKLMVKKLKEHEPPEPIKLRMVSTTVGEQDGEPITSVYLEPLAPEFGEPIHTPDPPEPKSTAEAARDFLMREVGTEPRLASELAKAAEAKGISYRSLKRARLKLGILAEGIGFSITWRRP